MKKAKIGVILGSGFDRFLEGEREISASTKYGAAEAREGEIEGIEIIFLNRHGRNAAPPHKINHRANISALKKLDVERIIATSAVGSMDINIKVGDLVLLDQLLDFSRHAQTFHDRKAVHVDVSEPFCPELRSIILSAAKELRLKPHARGTYVCVHGPRYETAAEIKAFKMLGGDVVGMTIAPECVLARETGICYSAISLATNFAAGMEKGMLSHLKVLKVCAEKRKNLEELILRAIPRIPEAKSCGCLLMPDAY